MYRFWRTAWTVVAMFMCMGGMALAQENVLGQDRRAEEVREELETGIIANPHQRAKIYLDKQDWERLYRHTAKWTRDFPGESQAWRYLGLALDGLQRPTDAADAHLRAWNLSDKQNHRIIARIAESYVAVGDWEKAHDAYHKALAIRPKRAVFWERLGEVALQRRHETWREDAKNILRKVLSFGEYINDVERWQRYADFLDEMAAESEEPLDEEEEWEVHRHVVRLDPNRAASWYRLYDIEVARGNEEVVDKIIQVLQNIDPGNPHSAMYYGNAALDSGKNERARKFFEQALNHNRANAEQRSQIHTIFGNLEKEPSEALGHYQKAISYNVGNRTAWELAIVMLRGLNEFDRAEQAYADMEQVLRRVKKGEEILPEHLESVGASNIQQ